MCLSGYGLLVSSPGGPGDDPGRLDLALGHAAGDRADFLEGPAHHGPRPQAGGERKRGRPRIRRWGAPEVDGPPKSICWLMCSGASCASSSRPDRWATSSRPQRCWKASRVPLQGLRLSRRSNDLDGMNVDQINTVTLFSDAAGSGPPLHRLLSSRFDGFFIKAENLLLSGCLFGSLC